MNRWTGSPWRRLGLPARVGWLVVGGYGAAAALVAASSMSGWNDARIPRPVDEAVLVGCLLVAAAAAGHAARAAVERRRRLGWLTLMTGLLGWAAGTVIWAVYEVRPEVEHAMHPATAEAASLLYPIGALASLALLSHLSRHSPRRVVLDGLILATSLFVISWAFVLDKQLRVDTGSRLATITQVFADVVLMTTAILMLSRARPGDRPSRSLLAGGIGTIAVADIAMVFETGIGSYHGGTLADLGRVAGLGMMTLAGLASVTESPTAEPRKKTLAPALLWLPYLPLLLAVGVGWRYTVNQAGHGPLPVLAGILVAAVLARQFVVLVENQSLLSEVAREAFRDSLTGISNRAHFIQRMEQAVARQRHDAAPIAVLCLDLDNFKLVNDALGHPAGDELLIRVAGRITAALGETGTVARLGGDEFAVLVEGSVEESQAAAQRVLDAFAPAIVIDGVPVAVRPSIGFTAATAASGCTVDQLLRHADLAMYAAKREGGQCIRSFVPDLPFPYRFPQVTGSPAAGGEQAPSSTLIPETAPAKPEQTTDASKGIPRSPTAIRIAFGILAIGVIAFATTSILNPSAGHSIFSKSSYAALNLLAAALIAVRAYRIRADRLGWVLIAAGMACSAMGDIVYDLWVPDGQSPSVADPAYLTFYPLVFAGLMLVLRERLTRVPTPIRLDALVCGLTTAAVAVALWAGPIHAAAKRVPATVLIGLVYPCGDLVLLAVAAGMLPILGRRNGFRCGLLIAGFIGFAIADTAYLFQTSAGSYRVGSALDALWPASSLLVAMASCPPKSAAAPLPRRGLGSYATPVACTVVALGVVVLSHRSGLAATLAALSLIAVTARFSVTFRDVSMLAESHKRAMTDELTALPNRRSLATALTALSGAESAAPAPTRASTRATSARQALLIVKLCEFHEINDSIGRHFGDELLCHIANRLSRCVRREDLLARTGDDEFAILMSEGSDLIAARAQAGRLLEALSEPFALDPITMQVDACIAIALCPDHCDHPQELLSRAETAVPQAKTAKGNIAVYDTAFELYRDNDPNVIEELRAALLDGDELTLYYQPKINASDGSVHSVEALLRWHHPTRGLLLPEEFLPAAERAGLMRKVAKRTVGRALERIDSWRAQGMPLTVAVNLSTTNLLDLELVGTIEGLLRAHNLPADALIVEITESALVDSVRSRNTVAELQRIGVRISIDDYGTGWSSLARLQDVSVDELKLDRIFVARLAEDPRSVAIVRSTVALARSLGAELVAEGVEDEITLSALRRYGCTITQGFVHSPPLPADELQRWIISHVPGSDSKSEAGVSD
ncbi:bifunctional diguanylate cyclase/phosphodiesterase [Mycobacterium sp. 663a-19]|uniref:bifunctional diguanylate cyclase/phosphodiesterase n=1 Tax=Mycobacterium sp. 663a-19 TaxID=2986148 RepID=UPI002D1F8007|nr:bifunctional diguanylate cyclase/phosphodiesterase [Mycobacterium sp. 663a-19]MEB3981180.1 bifunctional diguanylate cyclase/phosphodiesterase [Mycobacterium sp. 663a-19]